MANKEPVLVAVDGTYLMHRAFHVVPKSVKYMVFNWVCKYIVEQRATHVIVAFDSGRSFRHDILADYKGNRPKKGPDDISASDNLIPTSEYFASFGIHCEFGECYEADDVLHTAGVVWAREYGSAILATKDKDNLQGIGPKCNILRPGNLKVGDKLVTLKDLKKEIGLTPEQYLDYQTLIGDATDNIPKILTPAKAKNLILEHKSLKRYMARDIAWAEENAESLNRNRRLVKLHSNCFTLEPDKYAVSKIKKNVPNVRSNFYKMLTSKTLF